MQSMICDTADSVVLNQLFSVLNESFRVKGRFSVLIKTLGGGIVKILATLLVQRLFKSCDASGVLRFIMMRIMYKKMRLNTENSRDNLIIDELKRVGESIYISGIPIYLEKECSSHILYHFPYIHTTFIDSLCKSADQSSNTLCKDASSRLFTPLNLFASINYKKLDRIVSNFFEVWHDTEMVTPPLLVLQSVAGLGKSHSAHYLARLNKYGEIRAIDLTSQGMVNKSFSSIVAEILSKKSTVTTVIYFDELDKYVSMYTHHAYSKQASPENKNNSNMDEIVGSDYTAFEQSVKKSVLMNITQLNNNFTSFEKGVIFIFCANNFHTLFEGIDQTHVESIKSRFTFINFEECKKDEFVEYVSVFNSKVRTPHLKYDNERLAAAFNRVRDDLSITYRNIQICHARAAYDIDMLVDYVNSDIFNPLYSSSNSLVFDSHSTSAPLVEINIRDIVPERQITPHNRAEQKINKEKMLSEAVEIIKDNNIDEITRTAKVVEMIKENPVDLAETFIKVRPLHEFKEYEYMCMLYICCRYRRYHLLSYLIDVGVDINLVSQINSTPLQYAFGGPPDGYVLDKSIYDCVELLVNNGADVNFVGCMYCIEHLKWAAKITEYDESRLMSMIKLMIQKGLSDVNKTRTLHSISVIVGAENLIREIVSLGIDVDSKLIKSKRSALAQVCARSKSMNGSLLPNVIALIELGADINTIDSDGISCLQLACISQNYDLDIIKYLLDSGVDKTIKIYGRVVKINEITRDKSIIDLYNSYPDILQN